jgi:hypothetical protein
MNDAEDDISEPICRDSPAPMIIKTTKMDDNHILPHVRTSGNTRAVSLSAGVSVNNDNIFFSPGFNYFSYVPSKRLRS